MKTRLEESEGTPGERLFTPQTQCEGCGDWVDDDEIKVEDDKELCSHCRPQGLMIKRVPWTAAEPLII